MLLSIAKLASKHGIVPLKKYGQNFIYDESLCDKIVRYAELTPKSHILEIGPGTAGLTRSILKSNPASLLAIETDERCLALLEEIKQFYPKLEVRHADALKCKLADLTKTKFDVVANLPYNIGCKLLTNWLAETEYVNSITIMLQKEVVERLHASPHSKSYGRLSILCQTICDVKKCFDVSPQAFYPAPKVDSAIVRLVPRRTIPDKLIISKLEKITCLAFTNRRKILKSILKKISPNIDMIYDKLELEDKARAENISPEQYLEIAKLI